MARVQYSCLVNRILGLLGSSIYQRYKGTDYIRTSPDVWANPNSYRQQQVRGNFKQMQQAWDSVPPSHQELWHGFASKKGCHYFGHQAYVSLNCNLLNASHSDLTCISHPPLRPGTPKHVSGFCVYSISNSCTYLSWTKPDSSILYVTGHYRLHRGFCSINPCFGLCPTVGYRPSFRFIKTVRSDFLFMLHSHEYPNNTRLYYRLNTLDKFGRKSPISHTLRINSKVNNYFYVVDYNNHRVMKFKKSDMSFVTKVGSQGNDPGEFEWPYGCCCDHTYILVSTSGASRVVKMLKSNLSYFYETEGKPPPIDEFSNPKGLSSGEKYFFVADTDNHRVMKRLCSDMTGVCKIGSLGTGDGEFNLPYNLCTDHTYVYVADTNNHRIVVLKKSDLSFVSSFGAEGKGYYLFQNPEGIGVDLTYLYVVDTGNYRIVKYLKSDFSFISEYGSQGSGNNELNDPQSIAIDFDHIYIADRKNNRIVKILKSNYAFVDKVGTLGTGDTQFNNPRGVCLDDIYHQIYNQ